MKKGLVLIGCLMVLFSCTDIHDDALPNSFSISADELPFSKEGSFGSLTVNSGVKWYISSMPDWISINSITQLSKFPYEWELSLIASRNNGYDRNGTICFTTDSGWHVDVAVTQPGFKGKTITFDNGYGEYYEQFYDSKTDNYLIYLYEGIKNSDGSFIGPAYLLKLDILLPIIERHELISGAYNCSYWSGDVPLFIPTFETRDESGHSYLDGSLLFIYDDAGQSHTYPITDGSLSVQSLGADIYNIEVTVISNDSEYCFQYSGAITIKNSIRKD